MALREEGKRSVPTQHPNTIRMTLSEAGQHEDLRPPCDSPCQNPNRFPADARNTDRLPHKTRGYRTCHNFPRDNSGTEEDSSN